MTHTFAHATQACAHKVCCHAEPVSLEVACFIWPASHQRAQAVSQVCGEAAVLHLQLLVKDDKHKGLEVLALTAWHHGIDQALARRWRSQKGFSARQWVEGGKSSIRASVLCNREQSSTT